MDLSKYFNENYVSIKATDENAIKAFLENYEEKDKGKRNFVEPLQCIYMHKTFNEMYLVLNCINYSLSQIKKTCANWESIVLNYVNFGDEYKDNKRFLKYNIALLILCKDLAENEDDSFRYEIEKSKTICKKIFIIIDKSENIPESEQAILPFYFKPIENQENKPTFELENKLKNILASEPEVKAILESKEVLSEEDNEVLKRWLENYEF